MDATLGPHCGDVSEEAEVSFLSPERFKQLLLKVRSRLFWTLQWSVAIVVVVKVSLTQQIGFV